MENSKNAPEILVGRTEEVLAAVKVDSSSGRISGAPVVKKRNVVNSGKYPHVLSSLKLNEKYTMANRVTCAPMVFCTAVVGNDYGNAEYAQGKYAKLERPAAGGSAMVSVGGLEINNREALSMPLPIVDLSACAGEAFNAISEYAWRIKRHGAIALQEIAHGGMMKPNIPGSEIWGPSAFSAPDGGTVLPMDEDMMRSVCNDFAKAALFAQAAGFDGVCVHGGHGMLIQQFLSSRTNTRIDSFGGSLENRAKFPLRILKTIREYVGTDFLIELRVSGREGVPGGMEVDEVAEFVYMCEGIIDCVHVSAGLYSGVDEESACAHVIFSEHGYNADLAAAVKARTSMPVGVIGYINSPELAEQLLAEGKCDYIVMGRQMLADPEFIHKIEEGREKEIRQCVGCMHCLEFPDPEQDVLFDGVMPWLKAGNCVINPLSHLHNAIEDIPYPEASRRVVVVGGGPAGLQAAITAADRGHSVVLYEVKERLGGTLCFADTDAVKGDVGKFKDTLVHELSLRNVDVRLNTRVTPEILAAEEADAVILAVGAHAKTLPVKGIEKAIPALDVYESTVNIGKRVVMVGSGLVGSEAGLHLAKTGHDVTVVEMLMRIAHESCGIYRKSLIDSMDSAGIKSMVKTKCLEIRENGVLIAREDGTEEFLPADTVIYALGMDTNSTAELETAVHGSKVYKIGDCDKVAKIGEAIKSGFEAAMDIL